jgi:predicted NUDIX family NTP pyrophosphohydrolase
MAKAPESAGLLIYRRRGGALEVFLVHPGGPYWKNRDEGVWSIPKGLVDPGEERLAAAVREVREETGYEARGPFIPLGSVKLPSGKRIHAWACEGDLDPAQVRSNLVEVEFPPRSGRRITVPEVDRGQWFTLDVARQKIHPAQVPLLDRLAAGSVADPKGD